MIKKTFQIVPLSQFSLEQVLEFYVANYRAYEPLCKYCKYPRDKFVQDHIGLIRLGYESGFSFATKAQDQLAAMILAMPFTSLAQYVAEETPDGYSDIGNSTFPVYDKVFEGYQPAIPEKTIYICLVATKVKFQGKGLIQNMLTYIEQKGVSQGFAQFVAECTGKISQKVFAKQKFLPQNEIQYRSFEFKGKFPFQNLTQADTLKLMVKKITYSSPN